MEPDRVTCAGSDELNQVSVKPGSEQVGAGASRLTQDSTRIARGTVINARCDEQEHRRQGSKQPTHDGRICTGRVGCQTQAQSLYCDAKAQNAAANSLPRL